MISVERDSVTSSMPDQNGNKVYVNHHDSRIASRLTPETNALLHSRACCLRFAIYVLMKSYFRFLISNSTCKLCRVQNRLVVGRQRVKQSAASWFADGFSRLREALYVNHLDRLLIVIDKVECILGTYKQLYIYTLDSEWCISCSFSN